MFTEQDLFDEILIRPAQIDNCDTLLVATGYASAPMVYDHFEALKAENLNIRMSLLLGMPIKDGISKNNHEIFKELASETLLTSFECRYLSKKPQMHSKVYTWLKNGNPIKSFIGSANYTQTAFSCRQKEVMTSLQNPLDGLNYFNAIYEDCIECRNDDIENIIPIYEKIIAKKIPARQDTVFLSIKDGTSYDTKEKATLSFLQRNGTVPSRSGLNWGQRSGREPNQAYISIPATVYRTTFFPPIGVHFSVITDDGRTLICSRAQENGKGLHTPHNNSLMGEYFRNRLGLANGQFVERSHLDNYGRTNVDFYKIDDETYYMDFSV